MAERTLTGRVTPRDRERGPVLLVPFEVPEGTTRIDLAYAYDEGSLLDLGLADATLEPFPADRGLRGWSGSARRQVFVASDDATPGYRPGPLPAGTWHAMLGLARVASGGCDYRIDVTLDDAPRPTARWSRQEPRVLPMPGGRPGWLKGDWQSHTHYSDARGTLDDLVRAAGARGLDYLAVTDHNTAAHHPALAERDDPDLLLIPGEEITTYRGHANVWGAEAWLDFRPRDAGEMAELVARARARGGTVSINHPKDLPGCLGCDWQYGVPEGVTCFEAWQGPWHLRNWESLARFDAQLAAGRRLTLVGGSDRHQPGWPDPDPPELQVGSPTTWVWSDSWSVQGLLEGLLRGRVCVGEGPDGPRLDVHGDGRPMGSALNPAPPHDLQAVAHGADGELLRWLGPQGVLREVVIDGDPFEDRWRLEAPVTFLRAEIVARRPAAILGEIERRLAPSGERTAAFLRESRRHPLVRCLSNPLYGPPGASGTAASG